MTEDKIRDKIPKPSPLVRVGLIPFTGGIICFVYAFFWPEQYGHWLGTIVRSFRVAAGL